jgi:heme-degrading monooxygenase HmoA
LKYAALIEVDNSREDPDSGRRGLREELAPALKAMPGFDSALLLTAYDHGRGIAVVVFESEDAARAMASGFAEGQEIRDGVVITRTDVLEVSASA